MIYLVLPTDPPALAVCEDEPHAAPYRVRGFVEVSETEFVREWAERDRRARLEGEKEAHK